MAPKVVGWMRWVESGYDMVPYRTKDGRLVVYKSPAAADFDRVDLDVVDPITSADQKDVVKRFGLTGIYRVDLEDLRRIRDEKRRRYESAGKVRRRQPMEKRSKAPQSKRKAAQGNAKPTQLSLF